MKHLTAAIVALLGSAGILASMLAPGIWTTGSLLFLVFVAGFNHAIRGIPRT